MFQQIEAELESLLATLYAMAYCIDRNQERLDAFVDHCKDADKAIEAIRTLLEENKR